MLVSNEGDGLTGAGELVGELVTVVGLLVNGLLGGRLSSSRVLVSNEGGGLTAVGKL